MRPASAWNTLDVSVEGRVAWVRFNRPERRNGVTTEMAVEMYGALTELAGHDDVTVLVLTGAGDTFCPGADLRPAEGASAGARALPAAETYHSARLLRELPAVTIAAVNGACAGAGFAWAAACDLRVASASARFATAFVNVGLPGELGLAWTLPRIVGANRARELLYLSPKLDAEQAREYGFVSRVWSAESFQAELGALVDALAGRRPEALRVMKQSLLEGEHLTLGDYLTVESARYLAMLTGAGAGEVAGRLADQGAALRPAGE
ncbi:enoyl-CoA hydratase/isomerase family protein [Pseudofrankia inefficax]|uniref:Enoyl-CoA hydratase/isomerase n=1 Tax=Pseudofrankia inefficax (strain DSM 45817 / CECT 9037 / DDB 130130 / EuI1c) TaxID=298654 RepID=E3J5A7_PSEI1|nr:enoyl-CoA hydratase-related protein [Pseudofrankia inefficax]ADP80705.1 Enoyl-CoA hydratase/isomerase [Pseudofrankia inefficax]